MSHVSKCECPATDNTLCPTDVINELISFFTLHGDLQVELNTIRLLAEQYSGRVRSIQLPDNYQNRWDIINELGAEMGEGALGMPIPKPVRERSRAYHNAELKRVVAQRQEFLEQAASLVATLEDTAGKILAEAGFNRDESEAGRPRELANKALSRFQASSKVLKKAQEHNKNLMNK